MNDPHAIAAKLLEDEDFDHKEYAMDTPIAKYVLVWPGGFGPGSDSYYCGSSGGRGGHWRDVRDQAYRFLTKQAALRLYPDLTVVGTTGLEHLKIVPVYE